MTIGVLIVDDSALMRALLQRKLEIDSDMRIIGTAGNAMEARRKIKELDPDVVTLDIEMPGMDGLSFLEKIMKLRPTPVIIVSGATKEGAEATARALRLGAIHCYAKNTEKRSLRDDDSGELAQLVREAAMVEFSGKSAPRSAAKPAPSIVNANSHNPVNQRPPQLIAIGASTGGVEALHTLLESFPADCPPTMVVQHINSTFAKAIAASLDRVCAARVVTAHHDLKLEKGMVVVASDTAKHLIVAPHVSGAYRCVLRSGDLVTGHRPSVDRLFHSVAETVGEKSLGILLTGMGADGARGLLAIAQSGGRTIAQDQESCVVFGMPRAAIEAGAAQQVLPLQQIAGELFAQEQQAA